MPHLNWAARPRLAAFGLGLLAALAFPPLFVLPAIFLAFAGLLRLVYGTARARSAAWLGFWFGFGMNLIGLYWITDAILIESARYWWLVPLAVPALAVVMAVFTALPVGAARLMPAGWRRALMLAGAWTLSDLARQFVATGFPWNPLGSVWELPGEAGMVMTQLAALIGTPGLTLLTVLLAGLFPLGRRGVATAAVLLAAWAGFGWARLQTPPPPGTGMKVVLVQGNIEQGVKWDRARAIAVFQRHLDLTRQGVAAAGTAPSIVVWPETASAPFWLQSDAAARQAIAEAMRPARAGLIGTLTFTRGVPTYDPDNEPFNSLVGLAPDGALTGIYDKWHLVPFGEFAPSWFPLAIQLVPGRFGFGRGPATLHLPGIPPVGGLICYEAIFPAQVIDQADRPDWMVNVTNDAWFGNSTGPRQHLAAARMRAVEEGMPLMRAANTGISAGFDAFGRELARQEIGTPGALTVDLPGKLPPTLFSRGGLWIPTALSVLMICFSWVRRSR